MMTQEIRQLIARQTNPFPYCGPWFGAPEPRRRPGEVRPAQLTLFPMLGDPMPTWPAAVVFLALIRFAAFRTEAAARVLAPFRREHVDHAIRAAGANSVAGKTLRRFRLALSYSSPVIP